MSATYETIEVDRIEDGGVLRIALAHPRGNILSMAMMDEIAVALEQHAHVAELRMVLLCAQGKHFSFGASVEEHRREQAPAMLAQFHELIRQVADFPVPVVSLVQGACMGGAFELVLATHVVFATASARFSCPEIKLAVFPPVLAALGPLRLGGALSERLLLTGEELGPEVAMASGFVTRVLPDDAAEDAVRGWYREGFGGRSAYALRQAVAAARMASGVRAALDETLAQLEDAYVERVLPSVDGSEGIESFLERRPPRWEHR